MGLTFSNSNGSSGRFRAYTTFSPSLDPDAQAYIDALDSAGYTVSGVEETAINNHFLDLKGTGPNNSTYDWWTGIVRLLPFIGTTAAQQAIKAESPANSINFYGGVTHNSTGVEGNGTNGYYDFFFSSDAATEDVSVWIYKGLNQSTDTWDFGARNNFTSAAIRLRNRTAGGNLQANGYSVNVLQGPNSLLDSRGFTGVSKYQAIGFDAYYQGNQLVRAFDAFSDPALMVTGLAENTSFGPIGYNSNEHRYALATSGVSTTTEEAALRATVEAFMTALGRSV